MNKVLDNGLVILLLLASVAYAFASLGPKALRRRVLATLARFAARIPAGLHLEGLARRLEQAATVKSAGACGGCGTCGDDGAQKQSSTEVSVPLTKIGRRR
jgi:hypothetical protein